MAFVQRNGNQLSLDGKRFRFAGINTYPLIHSGSPYSATVLDNYFAKCNQYGIKVVRCWLTDRDPNAGNVVGNFQYISGITMNWIEATFAQADLVLDRAAAHGVKLSLVLCNEYPEFSNSGHKQSYCRWNNTINGTSYDAYNKGDDFYLDTNIINRFKAYCAKFIQRVNTVNGKTWSNDDTIFRWELINEGRFTTGADSNANTSSSYHLTSSGAWINTISTYIKSIDSNHLVSTGSESQYLDYVNGDPIHNGTYYGNDFQIHHSYTNIDDGDFHMYPYNDSPNFILRAYGQSVNNPAQSCAITSSGATCTVTKTNHGLSTNDAVYVTDCNEGAYNGTFIITKVDSNTFTYTAGGTPSASPATGSPRYSIVSLANLIDQLTQFKNSSKLTNNKPIIIGEWGLDKRNTRTDFLPAYTRETHIIQFFPIIFDSLDFDGMFFWHGAINAILDDNNYNIQMDGPHTGGNANSNSNDDDTNLLNQIFDWNTKLENLGSTSKFSPVFSVYLLHVSTGDLFELPFTSINWIEELNNGSTATFNLDFMTIKEQVAAPYGTTVFQLLTAVLSQIWVQDSAGNKLWFGVISDYQRSKDAVGNYTLTIAACDYFALLQKRRTAANQVYTAVDPATIPWDLININQTSGIAQADLGITQGATASTGLTVSPAYLRSDIKQSISDLSNYKVQGSFDFDIDTGLKLNIYYPTKGSLRANVVLDALTAPADGVKMPLLLNMTNRVFARGQGINTDVAESVRIASDPTINEYTLLEDVQTDTNSSDTTVLAAEGDKKLALEQLPLAQITKHHDDAIDLTTYGLGDTVIVDVPEENISYQQYRVKKRTVNIDHTGTMIATLELLTI